MFIGIVSVLEKISVYQLSVNLPEASLYSTMLGYINLSQEVVDVFEY
tara:strand:- start:630 stop:770 length:141 start_codon:yes stop_codon:yes gene_type:complete